MGKLLTLKTKTATLEIADNGCITSLKLKNGKEMIKGGIPMMVAEFGEIGSSWRERTSFKPALKENVYPSCVTLEGKNVLNFKFGDKGHVKLKLEEMGEYIRLTIAEIDLPKLRLLVYCMIRPAVAKYIGTMSGMFSDDDNVVGIRSLGVRGSVETMADPLLIAYTEGDNARAGVACALFASPRGKAMECVKAMQAKEPVPTSLSGGTNALSSDLTRFSYMFADFQAKYTDGWIDIAKRGGFGFIHFHAWWKTLGHYDVNPTFFPEGIEQMRDCVRRVKASGLHASFHTLTACIEPDDPWVTPVPSPDLIPLHTYTLSKGISEKDDVFYVNELPLNDHELFWSYSSNGNAFRIGEEIIRYSEISREKPYAFKQCERGAFGTKPSVHKAGEKAYYLQQRYISFYPDPDSKLADDLADAIADKFKYLGVEGMYYDGSEGMRTRYGTDTMRWKIFQRLPKNAVIEASNWNHNNWWFHSRLGAWDHTSWAMRRNRDTHAALCKSFPMSNFLSPQLGWWAARGPIPECRGQFIDEFEYFAATALSIDSPMSLQHLQPTKTQWNERIFDMLTLLGWYERFRLARYFTKEDTDRLQKPNSDFILRMDDKGVWKLRPQFFTKHRLTRLADGAEEISFRNPYAAQPFKGRIEVLYAADEKSEKTNTFVSFSGKDVINLQNTADGVTQKLSFEKADKKVPFNKIHIVAENAKNTPKGAWTQAGVEFPHPYASTNSCTTFGIWVKGDGSNALLNIQFTKPPVFGRGVSDHYITLDFKGWRYFTLLFRERDAEHMGDYKWPYDTRGGNLGNTRSTIDTKHVHKVSVFLNNVPAKGRTDVQISDIVMFPQAAATVNGIKFSVNGANAELPGEFVSGDYIEFDGTGIAEHYSEGGRLLRRFRTICSKPQTVAYGKNIVKVSAKSKSHLAPRLEFTVFTHGKPFGTRSDKVDWHHLKLEYEMPRIILGENGIDENWTISRRLESKASPKLDFTLDVYSAGVITEEQAAKSGRILEECSNAQDFIKSAKNDFEKLAFDKESRTSAKPSVRFWVVDGEDSSIKFTVTSDRQGDDAGWAAIGRKFPKPLDISKSKAVGFRLRSCVSGATLKMQLVDVDGKRQDFTATLSDVNWHYVNFALNHKSLNTSKIAYALFYLEAVPQTQTAWVEITKLRCTDAVSMLTNPILTIGDATIKFPCTLFEDYSIKCSDGKTWRLLDVYGKELATGKVQGAFPALKVGRTPVSLKFEEKSGDDFRVVAKFIKEYK